MESIFYIERLTEEYTKEISSISFQPHQHDFEELVVYTKGKMNHFIDFNNPLLEAPVICFVNKGKIHRVQMLPDSENNYPEGWMIRFSSDFIPETKFQLYANYYNSANIPVSDPKHLKYLTSLCEMMDKESKSENVEYNIIRSLLNSLFAVMETERKAQAGNISSPSNQNDTFKSFLKILEENFRRDTGVDFYAEKLNMSARNLNLICQNIMQKSVSEIIETRKLIEAKVLLINTDKPISEIGFDLGYHEKAYFTNVFKKRSGMTPSEFRNEMSKLIS